MESLTPQDALRNAVTAMGSQAALGEICGVSQAAVWKWLSQEKSLPAEHVLTVEAATGISRHALRPDIYPDESSAGTAALDHAASSEPARELRA